MSPRAKRDDDLLTGAALRQFIREEIERQVGGGLKPAPMQKAPFDTVRPTGFWCERCREVFESMGQLLAHDLAAHIDERIARAEARLRERTTGEPKAKGWA